MCRGTHTWKFSFIKYVLTRHPDERPVDCTGTIVYSFTEGAAIPTGLNRRGLSEASITAGSTVQRRTDSLTEASSDFSIDIMLSKVNDGRQSVGIIAGAAVGSFAIVVLAGTVAFMKYRSGSVVTVKKRESAVTGDSWSISPTCTEECFRAGMASLHKKANGDHQPIATFLFNFDTACS